MDRNDGQGVCGQRIAVVGTTGSGKTTLAGQVAARLGIPHVELDALHWEPNWQEAPWDVFGQRVVEALTGASWVVDGNYTRVRPLIWQRADMVIWLDYSLPLVLWRLWWRTLRRTLTGVELWNGNRERFWVQFGTRDSLFLWALRTYWRRRRKYPALFQQPEYTHLTVFRLGSPRAAQRWLEQLPAPRVVDPEASSPVDEA